MTVSVKQKSPNWLKRLMSSTTLIAGKEIACGYPKDKQQAYPDGTQVAEVAAIQCFGMGVPERDFMGYAQAGIEDKTKPILMAIAKLIAKPGAGNAINQLREAAGMEGAQAIKDAILTGDYVPNHPSTIRAKKSSKPLVDTGHMVNATTYVVRDRQ